MPQTLSVCFVFVLATSLGVAYQSQLQSDGRSGLKRAVVLQGPTRVSYGNFAVHKFRRLQVSVGSSSIVTNHGDCRMSCVNTPACSSFNIASSADSDGKFRCDLLEEDMYRNPDQLISTQEYHHYSIKVHVTSFTISVLM